MLRIGGLATGMDTHQMIDDLMRAERMPLNKLVQDRTRLEWQRDAYRDINLQMRNFRDSFAARGLGLQSTFLQKSVSSSNPSVVTATANANASNTTVQMQVERLATSSTFVSAGITDENVSSKKLSQWSNAEDIFGRDSENNLNSRAVIAVNVTRPGGEAETLEVEISKEDTLQSVITKMNRANLGFNAFLDKSADGSDPQVVLSMSDSGAGAKISFSNVPDSDDEGVNNKLDAGRALFGAMNFDFHEDTLGVDENNNVTRGRSGQNAVVVINGHRTERTTNQFTMNGVSYSLSGTTPPGEMVMVTATTNTDKIMEDIMKFVEDYNALIDTINGSLREERHRDYHPLSDEEKSAMSDREVELWEEKARSGLLRNDSTLSSALNQMRMALYSSVGTDPDRIIKDLSQIGLVSSRDYMDGGKIILDPNSREMPNGQRMNGEDRLRYYIENHGEELGQLFMGDGPTNEDKGIIRRLRSTMDNAINRITDRAGREGRTNHQFTLGRQLNNLEDRITNFERRMQQTEQRYWNQFTALEKAMAQMNSQAEQMWSMMSGMMGQ